MRQLHDEIQIDAPPEPIWAWLSDLPAHYTRWHPDHVSAEWVRGEPNQVGSVLEAVEILAGHREKVRFEITSVDPPHRLTFRTLGPISTVLPRGLLVIDAVDGGSRFTATISYRFGRVTETVFAGRLGAMRRHIREEGINLKRNVESSS